MPGMYIKKTFEIISFVKHTTDIKIVGIQEKMAVIQTTEISADTLRST
jgi:hypothetical protein